MTTTYEHLLGGSHHVFVVKGQCGQVVEWVPDNHGSLVRAGYFGCAHTDAEVRHADGVPARISPWCAVALELGRPCGCEAALFVEFTHGSGEKVFVGVNESAWECPMPGKRWVFALDEEYGQGVMLESNQRHVHGNRKGRVVELVCHSALFTGACANYTLCPLVLVRDGTEV